jgi:hypothetical protein
MGGQMLVTLDRAGGILEVAVAEPSGATSLR